MRLFGTKIKDDLLKSLQLDLEQAQKELNAADAFLAQRVNEETKPSIDPRNPTREGSVSNATNVGSQRMRKAAFRKLKETVVNKLNSF